MKQCRLDYLNWNNVRQVMHVRCTLPERSRVYAVIEGRVEFSGGAPWAQLNLSYPSREDGFLIYRFHGDWEIVVAQGTQVKQGDVLAIAKQPISDSQAESFILGRGKLMSVGFADVALPDEVIKVWEK